MFGIILGAVLAFIVIMFIYYYNRLVTLSNEIDNSLSQIDVQLKKRADLVPNLLASVKGYMTHEKGVITEVTNARKALLGAKTIESKVKAGNELGNALKSIFALSENYPDLKANTNFLHLQQELSAIEDKVAYSRQFYNDSTLSYNNACTTFPGTLFASLYNRHQKEFLKIAPAERNVPKVSF
ncbi:LemA family protein [Candidatus Pacearchaeota archaeon]|nr:LemA family protein [Candidatus Pacearchaeota archaeon]